MYKIKQLLQFFVVYNIKITVLVYKGDKIFTNLNKKLQQSLQNHDFCIQSQYAQVWYKNVSQFINKLTEFVENIKIIDKKN